MDKTNCNKTAIPCSTSNCLSTKNTDFCVKEEKDPYNSLDNIIENPKVEYNLKNDPPHQKVSELILEANNKDLEKFSPSFGDNEKEGQFSFPICRTSETTYKSNENSNFEPVNKKIIVSTFPEMMESSSDETKYLNENKTGAEEIEVICNEGINDNESSSDSLDEAVYSQIQMKCDWVTKVSSFTEEETNLLKHLRKVDYLKPEEKKALEKIEAVASEQRKKSGTELMKESESLEAEKEELIRDKACEKIARERGGIWRRAKKRDNEKSESIITPADIKPATLDTYTVAGQHYVINLMGQRPKTFKNIYEMKMWDTATQVNAIKQMTQIEEGTFLPQALNKKKELLFLKELKRIVHEAKKLSNILNEHISVMEILAFEENLVILDYIIKVKLKYCPPNTVLKLLNAVVNFPLKSIMILRQPLLIKTLIKLAQMTSSVTIQVAALTALDFIQDNVFMVPDKNFLAFFNSKLDNFQKHVKECSFSQKMILINEPTEKVKPIEIAKKKGSNKLVEIKLDTNQKTQSLIKDKSSEDEVINKFLNRGFGDENDGGKEIEIKLDENQKTESLIKDENSEDDIINKFLNDGFSDESDGGNNPKEGTEANKSLFSGQDLNKEDLKLSVRNVKEEISYETSEASKSLISGQVLNKEDLEISVGNVKDESSYKTSEANKSLNLLQDFKKEELKLATGNVKEEICYKTSEGNKRLNSGQNLNKEDLELSVRNVKDASSSKTSEVNESLNLVQDFKKEELELAIENIKEVICYETSEANKRLNSGQNLNKEDLELSARNVKEEISYKTSGVNKSLNSGQDLNTVELAVGNVKEEISCESSEKQKDEEGKIDYTENLLDEFLNTGFADETS